MLGLIVKPWVLPMNSTTRMLVLLAVSLALAIAVPMIVTAGTL
jgi:hypothetical protein